MPFVTLDGLDLHYNLEGDGPETLVLINGLADDLETWAGQMEDFLGAGYRVLRVDNRGIGKSGRPEGPYITTMMAADAKALVGSSQPRPLSPAGRFHGRHDRPGICALAQLHRHPAARHHIETVDRHGADAGAGGGRTTF
jgi:alpha-beta hydrolase superfamily lysophospholipase